MTRLRGCDCALALLCIAFAPLLLAGAMVLKLTWLIAPPIFGDDPAACLAERHRGALAILDLVGRLTLGLLLAAVLLRSLL